MQLTSIKLVRETACLILALAVLPVVAAEQTDIATWSGDAQTGLVSASGNADTLTLNVGIDVKRETASGSLKLGFSALRSEKDGVVDAERYELRAETERKLSKKTFWNANVRVQDDKFSAFDFQSTLALGYGRILLDSDRHELKATAGLGYRSSEAADTGESSSEAIFRGNTDYLWKITEHSSFGNKFLIEAGANNTYIANTASLTTKVSNKISMKLGFEVRHNTQAGPGLEKTDTLTTVNLVYGF